MDEQLDGRRHSNYRGRSPKKPETVALALDEMITYTQQWLRRYEESWFDRTGIPATELGFNKAGDLDKIPELCDYAIDAVADLARFAREAKRRLEGVKKEAEKELSQRHQGGE